MAKLERLTLQWQARYYSLAVEHCRGEAIGTAEQQVDDFWLATRLYRYRGFQAGIMELTVSDLVQFVLSLFDLGLIIVFAFETLNGGMSIGTFSALANLAMAASGYAGKAMDILTAVPGGYRALQQLADIMNQEQNDHIFSTASLDPPSCISPGETSSSTSCTEEEQNLSSPIITPLASPITTPSAAVEEPSHLTSDDNTTPST
jgi:ABC-type bacteriocin/lantibiotic exporter with double-glycine peptidase domain